MPTVRASVDLSRAEGFNTTRQPQVAPKLTDPLKKFKIGLLGGGIGRRRIVEMSKPLLDDVTGPDGEIDLAALRQAVNAGFDVAHKIPVAELGIEIDATDAATFFDGL